jgi:hypothetical protein
MNDVFYAITGVIVRSFGCTYSTESNELPSDCGRDLYNARVAPSV